MRFFLLSLLASVVVASPVDVDRRNNDQAKVTIYPQGHKVDVQGVKYPEFKQNGYLGIPFASPPVKDLRWRAPEAYGWDASQFEATTQPPACLQAPSNITLYGVSEDCLYLNILTPKDACEGKNLPVMVWVYGGSFTAGGVGFYNGTYLVKQGIETDRPFIFVAISYRLGILGFPNGKEAQANGAANLGLRDVKMGLEWVQENIWAFGGDKSKVTIFGQSAGAILTSLLYLDPSIDTFRGAIMESGAQSTAPIGPTAEIWQAPYDAIANLTNCSTTDDSFACLKAVPAEALLKAQLTVLQNPIFAVAFVFSPSIDGDIIPDSPHRLLAQGHFAKIPFISGNNVDEGTLFTPPTITNETILAAAISSIEPIPPPPEILQELIFQVYPDIPALGSPFGTGNETFGLDSNVKQAAAINGDGTFQSSRRWFLQQAQAHGLKDTWTYLFEASTPGGIPSLGVYHSAEVPYVFGVPLAQAEGVALNNTDAARSGSFETIFPVEYALLSESIMNYWISFAYYVDPSKNLGRITAWPRYGDEKNMLALNVSKIGVISDTYREDQIGFFLEQADSFDVRRSIH